MESNDVPSYLKSIQDLITKEPSSSSPSGIPSRPLAGESMLQTTPSQPSPQVVSLRENDPKKLQFLLVSTHCHQFTGYSKVSYGILQELSKLPWIQLTHFGFQKFHTIPPSYRPYPSSVEVLDAAAMENPIQQGFGFAQLPDIIRKKQPHVVMIYNDMAVVTKFLEAIRAKAVPRNFKIWIYCDQVYNTQLQAYIDILNRDADLVFTFSNHWKKVLKDQGVTRPMDVILHGFDSKQFFPIPKELARKQLGLPTDAFLFLNLNRNQPRKRLDLMLMAFVELIVKYPTKPIFLMSITDKGEKGGWWLFEIFKRELELRKVPFELFAPRLLISTQDMSFSDHDINVLYNIADVGMNTSEGEGWGLCNFEQMGCAVPQVVPDIGGFKEFCSTQNSMLVKPRNRFYLPMVISPVGGEATSCDPHDICLAMEEYLNDTEKRLEHGKAARETVLKYTWPRAMEKLIKRLDSEKKEVFDE